MSARLYVKDWSLRDAVWTGTGWLYVTTGRSFTLEQKGRRIAPRKLARVPLSAPLGCAWGGASGWFGVTGNGGAATLQVTRVELDGKPSATLAVDVDPAAKRRSPTPIALASAGQSLLLVWVASEGRDQVLRAARVRPR